MIFKKSSDLNVSLVQDMLGVSFHNMRNAARFPFGIPTAPIKSDRQVTPGELLIVDTTDGDVNLFLPRISGHFIGKTLFIKRVDNSTNNVILHSGPNDLINGETTQQITHILGTAAVTAITPTDWFVKFATLQYEAEFVPKDKYYYALGNSLFSMKKNDGDWEAITLPGSPENLLDVAGTAHDNMWVCGTYDSGRTKGYLATNRTGTWTEVEQSDLIIVDNPWEMNKLIVELGQVWVHATRTAGTGTYVRTYRWLESSGAWTNHYNNSAATDYTDPRSFTKKGTSVTVTGSNGNILVGYPPYHYFLNGPGPEDDDINWSEIAAGTNLSQDIDIHPNPSTSNNYRIIDGNSGVITLSSGSGGSWSTVASFGDAGSNYTSLTPDLFRALWVDELGTPYVLARITGGSPANALYYNWEISPTYIELGSDYASNATIHGIDQNEVCFLKGLDSNCVFQTWDGSSLSATEDTGVGAARALWCFREED